jgi:hypothetical protein
MQTSYGTRHLVALTQMSYSGRLLSPGDTFHATPVDADYYITKKKAKPAPYSATTAPGVTVVPPPEPDAPDVFDPPKVEEENKPEDPQVEEPAQVDNPIQPMASQESAEEAATEATETQHESQKPRLPSRIRRHRNEPDES